MLKDFNKFVDLHTFLNRRLKQAGITEFATLLKDSLQYEKFLNPIPLMVENSKTGNERRSNVVFHDKEQNVIYDIFESAKSNAHDISKHDSGYESLIKVYDLQNEQTFICECKGMMNPTNGFRPGETAASDKKRIQQILLIS